MTIDEIVIEAGIRRTRVALLAGGELIELLVDRADEPVRINDILLARISRAAPEFGGFFVDMGEAGAGLLARRDAAGRPAEGEALPVQVTRQPEDGKGPRVSGRIRLPGRAAVLEPSARGGALSLRIRDNQARGRLQPLADRLAAAGEGRLILREAAANMEEAAVAGEAERLRHAWAELSEAAGKARPPARLWREGAVSVAIREAAGPSLRRIAVDGPDGAEVARRACEAFAPELAACIEAVPAGRSPFAECDIDGQIAVALGRRVDLPGGGWLSFDATPALTAIDVNAAGGVAGGSAGRAALDANLAAVSAIARQLRLRDIGGIAVIDFVNMGAAGDGTRVLEALRRAVADDPADVRIAGFSEFGLVELTRQRRRPALAARLSVPCSRCGGSGLRPALRDIADDLLEALRRAGAASRDGRVRARCSPALAAELGGPHGPLIAGLAARHGLRISLEEDATRVDENFEVTAA